VTDRTNSPATPPVHAPHGFTADGAQLLVGGVPLARLAARIGRTPFYAYDRAKIQARVAELRAAMPAALHVHYAIKANPMPALVQLLAGLTDGLDVASVGEMGVALDTGIAPDRISFAGPGKTGDEIACAVAAGVTLNLESEAQLARALAAGDRLGLAPQVAIRVNPSFELKQSGMKMGGGAKPFGVDEDRVPTMIATARAGGAHLCGFHIYSGSQNLNADAIVDAQRKTVDLALALAEGSDVRPDWINIGGGFGVPYFPGERTLDLRPIGEALGPLCERAGAALGIPLVVELGRWLVAEAGIYVCRVLERKVSHGQVYLITDGGLHHHLAASGNFGQVIRKNYPVAIGTRMDDDARETQTVVGPLCTPLDVLGDRMALPPADVDDLVVVFRSGAYGPSASPRAFLGHPAAAEVLV
jgi:diaminopimelate decarboxylase